MRFCDQNMCQNNVKHIGVWAQGAGLKGPGSRGQAQGAGSRGQAQGARLKGPGSRGQAQGAGLKGPRAQGAKQIFKNYK